MFRLLSALLFAAQSRKTKTLSMTSSEFRVNLMLWLVWSVKASAYFNPSALHIPKAVAEGRSRERGQCLGFHFFHIHTGKCFELDEVSRTTCSKTELNYPQTTSAHVPPVSSPPTPNSETASTDRNLAVAWAQWRHLYGRTQFFFLFHKMTNSVSSLVKSLISKWLGKKIIRPKLFLEI